MKMVEIINHAIYDDSIDFADNDTDRRGCRVEMKKTVCVQGECTGCMACVDLCPEQAILIQDTCIAYNAVINNDKCMKCNICHKVCQNNNKVSFLQPISWFQGWIDDPDLRIKASSGGAARALSIQFLNRGGIVFSCCFKNGMFGFGYTEKKEELDSFTGSKYVKSNPSGIYKKIHDFLKRGREVLFIGLPCQVGALRTYIGRDEKLYTVDLICHGTPSPKVLKAYLNQHHIDISKLKDISFRHKADFSMKQGKKTISQPGSLDNYLLAFLCGLNYTGNCYKCKYAGIKRGSDITIGDSWGSDLPLDEQKNGISIMLCQTEKGEQLLKQSAMNLYPVDLEKAISANDQLREPSSKTKKYDKFFDNYLEKSFDYATFCCLPFKCSKQRLKALLLRLKIIPGGGIKYNISVFKY